MTRTRTIAAGVAMLLALALAAYAVAARKAGTVASYTGCLKHGKIESVAVGDTCESTRCRRLANSGLPPRQARAGVEANASLIVLTSSSESSALTAHAQRREGGYCGARSSIPRGLAPQLVR
jgi:hypothetical protein